MTKNDIVNYIDTNWQLYGYNQKPDKYIALTFDDGPCSQSYSGGTEAMLKVLDELKVKASFFLVGDYVRNNKEATCAIAAAGHEIGNHSNIHIKLGENSGFEESVIGEYLDAASEAIKETTGVLPKIMRPPHLDYGVNLTNACIKRNFPIIGSDADCKDYVKTNTAQIVIDNALNLARDGGIILLHETNTSDQKTLEALPQIIPVLRQRGFWIFTVSELAIIKEKTLEVGVIYNSIN
jgi:peptidoglycan/xylan/chitin deacetylase (PgdA/CDA1 family)